MPISIASKEDKAETVDLLRRLVQRFVFPGLLNMDTREAVLNHLKWIGRQKDMLVDVRFETIPELQATKFNITVTHTPQGPVKHHA